MEPAVTTITLTPHHDADRWSMNVKSKGLFSDETQALYGFGRCTQKRLEALVLEAVEDACAHERLSKELKFT